MKRRSAWAIFAIPMLIAAVTAAGLVAGLIGDGTWDAASWVGLGVPVLVAAWRYPGSPATVGSTKRYRAEARRRGDGVRGVGGARPNES